MHRFRPKLLAALGALYLGGCTSAPRYRAPETPLPEKFSGEPAGSLDKQASRTVPGLEAVTRWWLVFHDAELNALIDRATRQNLSLQLAVSRIREARAERALLSAGLWPHLDATAGYDRGRGSKNVELPLGGTTSGSSGAPAKVVRAETDAPVGVNGGGAAESGGGGAPISPFGQGGLPGVTTNLYQVGFDASWEIDVFGITRRAVQAADAATEAAEEDRRGALVSLLGEVATTYVELRAVQEHRRIAEANLAVQRDTLAIVQARFRNGLGTALEVEQQNALVQATEAGIPALDMAERTAGYALAFMLNEPPGALNAELSPARELPALPAEVPVGVPSDLLRRRPDIRRAERLLAAATAQVDVARAAWLPRFSLTGGFGFDSSNPGNLVGWDSRYYSIAPGIRWPLLDWARLGANVHVVSERQRQAFLAYSIAVAQALSDVENALVRYEKGQDRRRALASAAEAERRAHDLAQADYEHGVTDFLAALDAQRGQLQAEDTLAQSDSDLRRDLIALYKALGGGWDPADPAQ